MSEVSEYFVPQAFIVVFKIIDSIIMKIIFRGGKKIRDRRKFDEIYDDRMPNLLHQMWRLLFIRLEELYLSLSFIFFSCDDAILL